MRKRRQKKRAASHSVHDAQAGRDGDSALADNDDSKKRKREDQLDIENSKNDDIKEKDTAIIIPAHFTTKEAKKFRKDARRKVREEGGDESQIVFCVEGQEKVNELQEEGEPDDSRKKKKPKKSYPRINDLLEQKKQEQLEEKQEESRRQADERIPQEIKSKYLALDCEMVGIGSGGKQSALARVSLVDWNGSVVMDTFVKVPSRVTDFRTFVSGVRARDISDKSDAMDENECRAKVAALLKNKVLVGHALKNDLHALLLQHPKHDIRDTAKYRPFQRASGPNGGKWRPRKLRDLVKEHVGMTIQVKGESHDSTEDARATMLLFKRVREPWEKELQAKEKSRGGKKGSR